MYTYTQQYKRLCFLILGMYICVTMYTRNNRSSSNISKSPSDDILQDLEITESEVLDYTSDMVLEKGHNFKLIPGLKNPCFITSDKSRSFHCLPQFFLAGTEKCGSSDLTDLLLTHPHVYRPAYQTEVHWFNDPVGGQLHVHNGNIRGYSNLYNNHTYPCSNGTAVLLKCLQETRNASLCPYILGDYTPKYIIHGEGWKSKSYHSNTDEPKYLIPHKIFSMNKDSKIIFIVRDPTERLFSSYKYFIPLLNKKGYNITESSMDFHRRSKGQFDTWRTCLNLDIPFRSCMYGKPDELPELFISEKGMWGRDNMDQVRPGFYFPYIAEWMKVFPRNQLLVIRLEDYTRNKVSMLNKIILPFLGLVPYERIQELNFSLEKRTNSRTVSYSMSSQTREMLNIFYEPYNQMLSKLVSEQTL